VAGSYNASISFEGPLAGGGAVAAGRSYASDRLGRPYQFQARGARRRAEGQEWVLWLAAPACFRRVALPPPSAGLPLPLALPPLTPLPQVYPVVSSVSPAVGSVAGGTLLTIRGSGFPSTPRPGGASPGRALAVAVGGGSACDVVSSSFNEVRCVTRPAAAAAADANATAAAGSGATNASAALGFSAGLRGVRVDTFNRRCGQTLSLQLNTRLWDSKLLSPAGRLMLCPPG
jgi:hypothetical protein